MPPPGSTRSFRRGSRWRISASSRRTTRRRSPSPAKRPSSAEGTASMAYRVTVTARFEAAHNLIDYPGGPEPLHGHSYRVEAVLESPGLQENDIAVNFVAARKALEI